MAELILKSRLTVISKVYFQPPNERPEMEQNQYDQELEAQVDYNGRPYTRHITVKDWQPLDCGWIEDASLLVVENKEGLFNYRVPTEDERSASESRIVELSTDSSVPFAWVYPGKFCQFTPTSLRNLSIRCRCGSARIKYSLYPA